MPGYPGWRVYDGDGTLSQPIVSRAQTLALQRAKTGTKAHVGVLWSNHPVTYPTIVPGSIRQNAKPDTVTRIFICSCGFRPLESNRLSVHLPIHDLVFMQRAVIAGDFRDSLVCFPPMSIGPFIYLLDPLTSSVCSVFSPPLHQSWDDQCFLSP